MEYLIVRAQDLYAKNSYEIKQEERYNAAITYYQQFAEKYPTSKYLKEAQQLKRNCEDGIQSTKHILAEAETNQKLYKKIQQEKNTQPQVQKDSVTVRH